MPFAFKVLLLGDGGVGKTTLIKRYVTGSFDAGTKITIGADFHTKELSVNGKEVTLQVWDFGGEERFRFILPTYCRGARAGIFVYDVTKLESLLHAGDWVNLVRTEVPNIPVVMVGTKIDLSDQRVVQADEAATRAADLGINHVMEASSRTGESVEQVFDVVTSLIFENSPA
jgi:small GTP-binding protein